MSLVDESGLLRREKREEEEAEEANGGASIVVADSQCTAQGAGRRGAVRDTDKARRGAVRRLAGTDLRGE